MFLTVRVKLLTSFVTVIFQMKVDFVESVICITEHGWNLERN